jgi:hypothetical protein
MKLIIFWYDYINGIDKPIVYYDYPRYSVCWYLVRGRLALEEFS